MPRLRQTTAEKRIAMPFIPKLCITSLCRLFALACWLRETILCCFGFCFSGLGLAPGFSSVRENSPSRVSSLRVVSWFEGMLRKSSRRYSRVRLALATAGFCVRGAYFEPGDLRDGPGDLHGEDLEVAEDEEDGEEARAEACPEAEAGVQHEVLAERVEVVVDVFAELEVVLEDGVEHVVPDQVLEVQQLALQLLDACRGLGQRCVVELAQRVELRVRVEQQAEPPAVFRRVALLRRVVSEVAAELGPVDHLFVADRLEVRDALRVVPDPEVEVEEEDLRLQVLQGLLIKFENTLFTPVLFKARIIQKTINNESVLIDEVDESGKFPSKPRDQIKHFSLG